MQLACPWPHLRRDWAHPLPHLRRAWAHPLPHLRRDWAHPSHICTGTGLTPATSTPGLGSPLPHLRRDCAGARRATAEGGWSRRRAHDVPAARLAGVSPKVRERAHSVRPPTRGAHVFRGKPSPGADLEVWAASRRGRCGARCILSLALLRQVLGRADPDRALPSVRAAACRYTPAPLSCRSARCRSWLCAPVPCAACCVLRVAFCLPCVPSPVCSMPHGARFSRR